MLSIQLHDFLFLLLLKLKLPSESGNGAIISIF